MKILALAGKRLSGKTTAADLAVRIAERFNVKLVKKSFADPIKEAYANAVKIDKNILYTGEKEMHRNNLIEFGNVLREDNPSIFIDELFYGCKPGDYIVIDDLRRIEELAEVMKRGGIPYLVHTDKAIRESRGFRYNPEVDGHYSETELTELSAYTYRELGGGILYNNKTRLDLENELKRIVIKTFIKRLDIT